MNLFIQIKDGQPFEHPIIENNFCEAFPHININNLPPEFAKFERVPIPTIGEYEVYEGVTYEWDGDVVKDVHHVRPMTEQERFDYDEAKRQSDAFALMQISQQSNIGVTRV